ncbi:phage tail assembly protein T [Atlantibacter subterraneus]|uniref:phage tail assembly protein T n=1 Tax=Atlantibacter subterraneus TaxID=255519 RepID=UPI003F69FD31
MSFREFQIWVKYRERYGSLNPMLRTEWAAGMVSSTIANVNRGKDTPPFSVTDFTLHFTKTPTVTGPVTLDEAMRTWY